MNHRKLNKEEIEEREFFLLQYGLSAGCVKKIKETNSCLVKVTEAKKRLDNLKKLGFRNLSKLLMLNPSVIFRKEKSVKIRFFMVWSYLQFSKEDKNIFYFFTIKPQLWTAGLSKLTIVIYLAKEKKASSNLGRVCSMLTLALEDILLAHFEDRGRSFPHIYSEAKSRISKSEWSRDLKRQYLEKINDDLMKLL